MMYPMPILIPSGNHSAGQYIYPKWVSFIFGTGLTMAIVGVVAFLIIAGLWLLTDNDKFDPMDRCGTYALVLAIGGLVIILIAVPLMVITGVSVTE